MSDPGWRPAIPIALRIATLRAVDADLLLTLRGITLFALATSSLLVPLSYLATWGAEASASSTVSGRSVPKTPTEMPSVEFLPGFIAIRRVPNWVNSWST